MFKSLLLLTLFSLSLYADLIQTKILDVNNNIAVAKLDTIQLGVSGFIVREFTPEHSSIIANAVVKHYDKNTHYAEIAFTPYTGLRQNSLPSGKWNVKDGDTLVLAFGYSRSLLIAPTEEVHDFISSRIKSVTWMHPDEFTTFLSYRGHPSPLKKDFSDFCTFSSAGLAYIFAHKTLFTLDCQSLQLLQITEAPIETNQETMLPFYSRIETIREAWWGEGSNPMQNYDYYLKLMIENNPNNKKLYAFIKSSNESNVSNLQNLFELKEN